MLVQWRAEALWLNKSTNAIIAVQDKRMIDLDTQSDLGPFEKAGFKQIKPNSGVRNLISGALVAFQLNAPDIAVRKAALAFIRRNEDPAYLPLLEQSLRQETDPALVGKAAAGAFVNAEIRPIRRGAVRGNWQLVGC